MSRSVVTWSGAHDDELLGLTDVVVGQTSLGLSHANPWQTLYALRLPHFVYLIVVAARGFNLFRP